MISMGSPAPDHPEHHAGGRRDKGRQQCYHKMSVNPLKDLRILVPGNREGVNTMRGKDRKCSFQQWFSHIHLERQTFIK